MFRNQFNNLLGEMETFIKIIEIFLTKEVLYYFWTCQTDKIHCRVLKLADKPSSLGGEDKG